MDLSSLARERTCSHCTGRRSFNHWMARKVPRVFLLPISFFGSLCHGLLYGLQFSLNEATSFLPVVYHKSPAYSTAPLGVDFPKLCSKSVPLGRATELRVLMGCLSPEAHLCTTAQDPWQGQQLGERDTPAVQGGSGSPSCPADFSQHEGTSGQGEARGTKNSCSARPAAKLCPRNGGGVEEGSLRSPRVWIELLQQGAGVGRGEMPGAGGLPFLVRCLRPGAGTGRGQTQQSWLDKQRGASVSLSLARVGNGQSSNAINYFFFFNFLMWTILKIKSLLKSLTVLLLFYVSIF